MAMIQEVVNKLKSLSFEDIERALQEQEDREIFEILLICRELKKLLEETPQSYTEVLAWDFYWNLYFNALKTWLSEYQDKFRKEVNL